MHPRPVIPAATSPVLGPAPPLCPVQYAGTIPAPRPTCSPGLHTPWQHTRPPVSPDTVPPSLLHLWLSDGGGNFTYHLMKQAGPARHPQLSLPEATTHRDLHLERVRRYMWTCCACWPGMSWARCPAVTSPAVAAGRTFRDISLLPCNLGLPDH